ncbi:MAG TPA: DNA helicase RecQ [Pirellulales bacterium]|jgi:ATP-dependent DNA helicase RecQ|nr:DNA helicase RecQ [Pirellulales bacterium]
MPPPPTSSTPPERVLEVVRRYWGYDTLRPLQADAIAAALAGRDSLVVMPTGGGKSLCYQVPPAVDGSTDIVISPLISLMKDQVDGLRTCGYPAACVHSGLSADQRREVEAGVAAGKFRLLFVAPERVTTPWFMQLVERLDVRRFAIDEAHCISHWGHDFRPDYRQLAVLRKRFSAASFHAFTATATPRVQGDIVNQLGLHEPAILIGRFDRPNLIFRIVPLVDRDAQILDVIRRHSKEAVIVYCISRRETESMAALLQSHGIRAAAYHAGLAPEQRHRAQEAFAEEQLDVVVATVAFGMGIDRSNVRCVLHAAMPKSVEHYQQETGRAGRDGLEAECVLLYSAADAMRWESLVEKSAEESPNPEALVAAQKRLIKQIQSLCNSPVCRHKVLSEYFGQPYDQPNCGACDFCLNEVEGLEDGTVTAQKILSCVARTGERFGVKHIVDVLQGAKTDQIRKFQHDQLSTYGLLRDLPKKQLQAFVFQLVDQGLVGRSEGEYPVLALNERSWEVLRGQLPVRLVRPKERVAAKTKAAELSWEGVDRGLFDHLRDWRRRIAVERGVPAYVVLHDATLMDLARIRPTEIDVLRSIHGFGVTRLRDLGESVLQTIDAYCREHGLSTNQPPAVSSVPAAASFALPEEPKPKPHDVKRAAFDLFNQGRTIEEVVAYIGRAHSTVVQYLAEFIAERRPERIDLWVDPAIYQRVAAVAAGSESPRLKPLHDQLGGAVSYDDIRLVITHLSATL